MDTKNRTASKSQTGTDSGCKSIIKTIGNWIINNSDSILKLTGSIAIVIGTLLVANYESKMSAITLINQREQAESELRSNMFSHLISPVAGPYQDSEEVDSHRECVLVKLLALNFHELTIRSPHTQKDLPKRGNDIRTQAVDSFLKKKKEPRLQARVESKVRPLSVTLSSLKSVVLLI